MSVDTGRVIHDMDNVLRRRMYWGPCVTRAEGLNAWCAGGEVLLTAEVWLSPPPPPPPGSRPQGGPLNAPRPRPVVCRTAGATKLLGLLTDPLCLSHTLFATPPVTPSPSLFLCQSARLHTGV